MAFRFLLLSLLFATSAGFQLGSTAVKRQFQLATPGFSSGRESFSQRSVRLLESTTPSEKKEFDLVQGYRFSGYLYAAAALVSLFLASPNPATKIGGAMGYGMAAGLSYIVEGAVKHDRLKSDTYKRLNLGLVGFGSLGLLAFQAGFLALVPAVAKLLGVYVAFRGWQQGVDGSLLQEITTGTTTSLKSLLAGMNKGSVYGNLALAMLVAMTYRFSDLMVALEKGLSRFRVALDISSLSRLFLATSMCYTLKDAGERDRSTGTTFIQITSMLSLWFFFVGIGQGFSSGRHFLLKKAKMMALAPPLALDAVRNQLKKMKENEATTA